MEPVYNGRTIAMYQFGRSIGHMSNGAFEHADIDADMPIDGNADPVNNPPSPLPRRPLVSVIMPCYNVERYVGAAIESVLGQTYGNLELFCVNDGSTDGTLDAIAEAAGDDPRVHIIDIENGGAPHARNVAMSEAGGKYVMFFDADDDADPEIIAKMVGAAERDGSQLVICGFDIVTLDGYTAAGKSSDESSQRKFVETKSVPSATYRQIGFRYAACGLFDANMLYTPWNKLFRIDRLRSEGIEFRDTFWDDFPFVLDYIRDVESVTVLSDSLYNFYRRRADSETARYRGDMLEKRDEEDRWMRDLYAHWGLQADPKSVETVDRRYIERIVGCVANECSPANETSLKGRLNGVRNIMGRPFMEERLLEHGEAIWVDGETCGERAARIEECLKTAKPRSVKMKIMLIPYRIGSPVMCMLSGMFIEWVRQVAPTVFAKLKASR